MYVCVRGTQLNKSRFALNLRTCNVSGSVTLFANAKVH